MRARGLVAALPRPGLALDPALVYQGDFSEQSGLEAGRHLLSLDEPPTAIFAANDGMALGCMNAAREKGVRIPEDLSLIGFDDIPAAAMTRPPLTTLRHPFGPMAQAAVQELVRRIRGEAGRRHRIEFPSEFIIRESTGPAPGGAGAKRGKLRRA